MANLSFGDVDVIAEVGDSLRLTVAALDDGDADLLLAYGTFFYSSSLRFG